MIENKLQINTTLEEVIYYIMFALLFSLKGLGLDEGQLLFRLGLVFAILLFGMKILVGNYTLKELVIIALGGIWSIYIFFNMGSLGVTTYALIILGMKNISVEKVMKVAIIVWSVCLALTLTAGIFFHRAGVQVVHEKLGLGPVLRESLGYGHPNVLHVTYIVFMALALYSCKKEKIVKTIAALLVGNSLIFFYSLSYTGLLISLGLIIINLYFLYRNKITMVEKTAIKCVLPVCILLSTVLPAKGNMDSYLLKKMNSLLNNRLWASRVFFDDYTLTLFGRRIQTEGFSLDNSYLYALAWYGIVFLVVVFIGYFVLIKDYLKKNKSKELAIIITFLFAGLTEQFLFNSSIKNITFIFMGEVLYSYTGKKNRGFQFLNIYNKTVKINCNKLQKMIEFCEKIKWKKVLLQYSVINALMLFMIFQIPIKQYSQIYVNEKICDCNGEIVSLEEIKETEDTFIIGAIDKESQYYHFTEDNSNFILIVDTRYKISLSIYLSVLLVSVLTIFQLKRRTDET